MTNNNLKLQLEIAASGAGATVAELLGVRKAIEQTAAQSAGITQLANAMGTSYDAAKKFAEGLKLTPEQAIHAIATLKELNSVNASGEVKFATLTAQMGITAKQFQSLDAIALKATQTNHQWSDTLTVVAFKFNQIHQAIQGLTASLKPAYDLLIGSNEQLNQGILSSAATLGSATEISKGGQAIKDPTAQIKALQGPIREALKDVEKATLDLVGVTSQQTSEIFSTILTNAGQLDGQLKSLGDRSEKFADPLKAAAALAPGLVATLGTLGLPLQQANQEIRSLLQGEIDQNAQVAKRLGITRAQVELWKSQGTLVDNLIEKFKPFVAANALAAQSIGGITSNIRDTIEILGRTSGKPLLDALIPALDSIYKYLQQNQEALSVFFQTLIKEGLEIGTAVGTALAPLGKSLLEVAENSGPIALAAIEGIKVVILGLTPILTVLTGLLGQVLTAVAQIASSDLGKLGIEAAVITLAISNLATVLAGLAAVAAPAALTALTLTADAAISVAAALGAATAGATTLGEALVAVGAIAVTTTAIFTALAAAATAVAIAQRKAAIIEDVQGALDTYLRVTTSLSDEVERYSGKLKQLQEIEKNGGTLTAQQIEQKKVYQDLLNQTNKQIDAQIAELKSVNTDGNEAQANQVKGQIAFLERSKKRAEELTAAIQIQGKVIVELGDDAEQLNKKAKGIFDQLNRGRGDDAAFKAAAKEAVDITKQQLQLGTLTEAAGQKQLEQIRNDKKIEVSVRAAARTELINLRKSQGEAELAAISASQAQIEARQKAGYLGEADAQRELTKVKLQELDKRIAINRAEQKDAFGSAKAKLVAEERKLQTERISTQFEAERKANELTLKAYDERRVMIDSNNKRGLISQQAYNATKLSNDLRQQDEALKQQNIYLNRLVKSDTAGRQVVLSKIAEINAKKEELILANIETEKKRVLTDFDEKLTELDKFNAKKLISEGDYFRTKTANQVARADKEIEILTKQSARLGKADKDGREAIQSQISKLQIQKIKILEEGYANELILVKDREAKLLDFVKQSQQQRAIDLQKLINNRSIRQEDADKERNRQTVANQQAELQQAQDFEAALTKTARATRSPEAERAYQQQVREARAKTLAATIAIVQTEGVELERLRTLALKGIEDQVASRTRAADLQLSQIAKIRAERERSTKDLEANSARELAAIEIASKALERQNGLINAKNNLQKSAFDAQSSGVDIELTKANRSLEIAKELNTNNNLSVQEKSQLLKELYELEGTNQVSISQLASRRQEIEQRQLQVKRESVLFEQSAAKIALTIEQQKNALINQRLVLEARLAEFKAKQAILDAQSVARQTEVNNQKSIEAAQLAVTQAKALAPGRERDRAIAEAENKLKIAQTEAQTNSANANQGIDLARQQASLATQNTDQALKQVDSQATLNKLQNQTLETQQQMVLKQLEATESAKLYAAALERAKYAAEGILVLAPQNNLYSVDRQPVNHVDPNADLTQGYSNLPTATTAPQRQLTPLESYDRSLNRAQQSTDRTQPVVNHLAPNTDFTQPLDRQQIIRNLGGLGGLTTPSVGQPSEGVNGQLLQEIVKLQQIIQSKPPAPIIANFNAPDDDGVDKLFALHRSNLRGI